MPDLTLTVPVYINLDPGGPVLVKSSTNQLPLGPLRVVSGDERLFSFRLHQTPEGSTWQRVGLPSGWTMVLSGKRAPGGETAYFTNSTWTSTGTGSTLAYTATLDWAVSDSVWANATDGVLPFRMDLEIRDATNTVRGTVQFDLELHRENYGSGDATYEADEPFLDRTAADNIYLSFAAAQPLTALQQAQAWENLGGTTYTLGLLSSANQAAHLTALGLGSTAAVNFGYLCLGPDEDNGFTAQGTRAAIISATLAGAADATTFTFDATGLTVGMYAHDAFPSGTTIQSIGGTAPTHTVQLSAGKLTSGTDTVRFSTVATPFPRIALYYGGTTVFSVDHTGTGTFAGGLTVTGTIIAGTVNAATFAGTVLNLESDGGITQGGFTLTLGGNVTFTAIGRALANLANPSAVTFPRINADNSATALTAADMRLALFARSRRMVNVNLSESAWGTATLSGTVASNQYTSGARVITVGSGVAGAARARLFTVDVINYCPGTRQQVDYSQDFSFDIVGVLNGPATAGTRLFVTPAAENALTAALFTAKGLGVSAEGDGTNLKLELVAHNGTALATSDGYTITPGSDAIVRLTAVYRAGVGFYLYFNGTLVDSLTTGLPTGLGTSGHTCPTLIVNHPSGGTGCALRLASFSIEP